MLPCQAPFTSLIHKLNQRQPAYHGTLCKFLQTLKVEMTIPMDCGANAMPAQSYASSDTLGLQC
jgi:hypothetical protein